MDGIEVSGWLRIGLMRRGGIRSMEFGSIEREGGKEIASKGGASQRRWYKLGECIKCLRGAPGSGRRHHHDRRIRWFGHA